MKKKFKMVATGLITGTVNGLFGTGGGMVLVPLLRDWLKIDEKKAFALSVAIILPVCLAGLVVYISVNGYKLTDAVLFSLGGIAGGFAAGKIFEKAPAALIRKAFGALLVIGGIRTAFF